MSDTLVGFLGLGAMIAVMWHMAGKGVPWATTRLVLCILTICVLALCVGACFPTADLWNKDGASYDQTEADWATCTSVMEKECLNNPFIIFPRDVLADCMARKGYTKETK